MKLCPFASIAASMLCALSFAADPGQSPQDSLKAMKVPDGFSVSLCAGEPDVVQPVAIELDDRGRLWVAEFRSYPKWKAEGKDRLLILEDKDGDGKYESSKVFWDKGNYLSGFTFGFGGVWVCSAPNLYFIPMKDGEDTPAGDPQIVLDGWGTTGVHNVFNSLLWGPDGWLYGCSGITGPSRVGKPGTPDDQRVPINCGVWRYHPTKKVFEAVLHGTTNPWGIDYDDWGQMFITNNVIGHLWHVIPGMHTKRMFGEDFNKYTYELLEQTGDHIHWGGGNWTSSRGGKGAHDAPGGGHSHCGGMIYLGDNWPDKYRNSIFMCNTHGNRINSDILRRRGSGYVGLHGPDILFANDPLFRGTTIKQGPDGGVYFADWNQGGECHTGDLGSTGRVYKLTYGKTAPYKGDVSKLSDDDLVKLQLHKNDWLVRRARRVLQERAAAGTLKAETAPALQKMFDDNPDVTRKLRAMWALNAIGAASEDWLARQLDPEKSDDNIRAWAVRLLSDFGEPSAKTLDRFAYLAKEDPSALVRLHLASALQKLPAELNAGVGKVSRANIIEKLLAHAQDATDATLPLMYWYALEPLIAKTPVRAPLLGLRGKIPLVRQLTARRATELNPGNGLDMASFALEDLDKEKKKGAEADKALLADLEARPVDVLTGMATALRGQRDVKPPFMWSKVSEKLNASENANVRKLAVKVAVVFGDLSAMEKYRALSADAKAPVPEREVAVEALVTARDTKGAEVLQGLLSDAALRGAAIRGLAVFDDEKTAAAILSVYSKLDLAEKGDALYTLGARQTYASALLEALKNKTVPKEDLNAFTLRYLEQASVPELTAWIKENWGGVNQTSDEKKARIEKYKKIVQNAAPQAADIKRGQEVFKKTCFNCHTLFGEGGKVGPDLTGSGRNNLDYVMLNIVDPNALVPYDYQVTVVKTKDGRMLSGLERNDRDKTFDLITTNEVLTLSKSDVAGKKKIETSMMPEGILDTLTEQQVIDLVAYLQSGGTR